MDKYFDKLEDDLNFFKKFKTAFDQTLTLIGLTPNKFTNEQFLKALQYLKNNPEVRFDYLVNVSAISSLIILVLGFFVEVDIDLWGELPALKILQMMPLDNWERYMDTLQQYPIAVKAATSGLVYIIGDIIS